MSTTRSDRRTELLEAAVSAVRELGPHATMEQLAAAGGVTKPILYRHFGDRDGLITAMASEFAGNLVQSLRAPMRADRHPRDIVRSTIDAYVGFIDADANLSRFLIQQAASRRQVAEPISALVATIASEVGAAIGDQLRQRGLDDAPAVPWAYGLVGFVHQAGDWWVDHRTMSREVLVDHLTTLLWDGLGRAADRT